MGQFTIMQADFLFCVLTHGNITCNAMQGIDSITPVTQRYGMGLHPKTAASQADDLKLHGVRLAGKDTCGQRTVFVSKFRHDEIVYGSPDVLVCLFGALLGLFCWFFFLLVPILCLL